MRRFVTVFFGAWVALTVGCGPSSKSARGFRLPDGNIEQGKLAFIALQCHRCHPVEGVELPALDQNPEMAVRLGGEVINVKTYGELVTSVINPSHKLSARYKEADISRNGKSLMTDSNEVMTVRQMIDVVAFLQSRYERLELESWRYQ